MFQGRYDYLHGDEDEIEAEQRDFRDAYEAEHENDWEYEDD